MNLTENGCVPLTRGQLNANCAQNNKVCYVCKKEKPRKDFSINRSRADGLQTYCKLCGKERQSKWYYKRAHGISLAERDALLKRQSGKCAICGNETQFKLKAGRGNNIGTEAVIDHCHDTKKIRGVLCGACNSGLGQFKDNIDSLYNAIEYIINSTKI